jgi:NAD(P)H-quinone oxidoreductase subunit 5
LGKPQIKTRRAPEVAWQMAIPIVSLTVVTLIASVAPIQWPLWLSPNTPLQIGRSETVIQYALPLLIFLEFLVVLLERRLKSIKLGLDLIR